VHVHVLDAIKTSVEVVAVEPFVNVHLNTPAVLHCYAMGWPRPSVTWWRAERILPMASKRYEQRRDFTLLLASVSLEDLGPYTCQAYNGEGKAKSWTITVQGFKQPGTGYSTAAAYYQYLVDEPEQVRPPVYLHPSRPQQPYPPPQVDVRGIVQKWL